MDTGGAMVQTDMVDKRLLYLSGLAAVVGVYTLYAGLLHNPLPTCLTGEEIGITGSVHFGSDLALRYCKVGTDPCCKPYDGAMRVFWGVTTFGVGLAAGGVFGLRRAGLGTVLGLNR